VGGEQTQGVGLPDAFAQLVAGLGVKCSFLGGFHSLGVIAWLRRRFQQFKSVPGLEYLRTTAQSPFASHDRAGEVPLDLRHRETGVLVSESLVNLGVLPRVADCLVEVPAARGGISRLCVHRTVHTFCF